ncbi:MAG: glycosyltransferase family 1 protein, partial [Chloroflexi bacterium]|nr:glycosyltransferase family 1 protein [Chloroflexota bacterium]
GDIQPCVALGKGLADAGYEVRVVTMANFEPMVRQHGLEFFLMEGDAEALVKDMLRQMDGKGLQFVRMYRGILRTFGAISRSYHKAFSAEALRDSDAMLSQLPGGFYSYDLAEALQIPYIALSVIPQEPTRAWPVPVLPTRASLGQWYNRQTFRFTNLVGWQPFRAPINRFRAELGLKPASFLWGNTLRIGRERVPVIQGFSEQVVPTPPEWGEHIHTTGYWILDEPDWQPSPELRAFLDAGDPPVAIGFGSMPVPDPDSTTRLILEALESSGQRAILLSGWAQLGRQALPETVFPLDYAPYPWLFPRMAAIIHHGGSGTTGLALRSGVPSLVIPFTADQPFWGERTHALGVGPAALPFSTLTADDLAAALRTMLSDVTMQQRAAQLRDAMAAEQGIQTAVAIIRDYLDRWDSPGKGNARG